jgi:predicted nucleotidyltransferase
VAPRTLGFLAIDAIGFAVDILGMTNPAANDPVLKRFRTALDRAYGDRLERVILFGSRARGDAHPDSDYDIAVFLNDLEDRWEEFDRLADIGTDLLTETGAFVHAMPFPAGAYQERTPLMHEVRQDGVDL